MDDKTKKVKNILSSFFKKKSIEFFKQGIAVTRFFDITLLYRRN